MCTLEEFKEKAIYKVSIKLDAQAKRKLKMDRTDFVNYINGLINGYELTVGAPIERDIKKMLLVDIMIDSGVMAEVLV